MAPALGNSSTLPFIATIRLHGTPSPPPPPPPPGQLDLSKASLSGFNLQYWIV